MCSPFRIYVQIGIYNLYIVYDNCIYNVCLALSVHCGFRFGPACHVCAAVFYILQVYFMCECDIPIYSIYFLCTMYLYLYIYIGIYNFWASVLMSAVRPRHWEWGDDHQMDMGIPMQRNNFSDQEFGFGVAKIAIFNWVNRIGGFLSIENNRF